MAAGWALLVLAGRSPAQTTGSWTTYLNGNQIQELAVDGEHVWAATDGGLVRLLPDGQMQQWNHAVRGLLSDSVQTVAVDASGKVWCGTPNSGISIFDYDAGRWEPFTSLLEAIPGDRIRRLRIHGPAESETLLVGTTEGFAFFVSGNLRETCYANVDLCALPSHNVRDLMFAGDSLWLATDRGATVRYPARGGEPAGFRDHSTGLGGIGLDLLARADRVYGAGSDGRIWAWNGASWEAAYEAGDVIPVAFRCRGLWSQGDTLWAAGYVANSGQGGVYRHQDGLWSRVGPPLSWATSVARTASGRLLAGTVDRDRGDLDGIWEYLGGSWVQHKLAGPDVRQHYRSLAFDAEGALWLSAAESGARPILTRFFQGAWTVFRGGEEGRSAQWTFDILPVGDQIWLGHCCCTADNAQVCTMERVSENGEIFEAWDALGALTMDTDARGRIWVGTQNRDEDAGRGLYRIDPADGSSISFDKVSEPQLRENQIQAVVVSGRLLWIGYKNQGLSRWDLGSDQTPQTADDSWTHFTHDPESNSLLNDQVTEMAMASDGKLWIGTTEGISIFDGSRFTNITAAASRIPQSNVTALLPVADGAAWVGTRSGGLTRMTVRDLGGYNYETFARDYLPNVTIEDLALDPDGRRLWIATERGLASFLPQEVSAASEAGQAGAYPNPFRSGCSLHRSIALTATGGRAGGVIVDLTGRVVGRFADREPGQAVWNGRIGSRDGEGGGEPAAPGLYIIRALTPTGEHSIGVAVVDAGCD